MTPDFSSLNARSGNPRRRGISFGRRRAGAKFTGCARSGKFPKVRPEVAWMLQQKGQISADNEYIPKFILPCSQYLAFTWLFS